MGDYDGSCYAQISIKSNMKVTEFAPQDAEKFGWRLWQAFMGLVLSLMDEGHAGLIVRHQSR